MSAEGRKETSGTRDIEKVLDRLYQQWRGVRSETIFNLGEKEALFLVNFHFNNVIDITSWMGNRYPDRWRNSCISFDYCRFFKGLLWMNFYFIHGNYPAVYRDLRYFWESLSISYLIESKYPKLSIDDQMAVRRAWEERGPRAWSAVKKALSKALRKPPARIKGYFHPLWQQLCRHAHPSAVEMDKIATIDFSSLMVDSFNRELAEECMDTSNQVLDCIHVLIFDAFPLIIEDALRWKWLEEWRETMPWTYKLIHEQEHKSTSQSQSQT
jgi:hypothetical protein